MNGFLFIFILTYGNPVLQLADGQDAADRVEMNVTDNNTDKADLRESMTIGRSEYGFETAGRAVEFSPFNDIPSSIDFEYPETKEAHYYTTVNVGRILSGSRENMTDRRNRDSIIIGMKKPYYRIFPDPFVRGTIDLRVKRKLLGLENLAVFTIGYKFAGTLSGPQISSSVYFDGLVLKIFFPFGPNGR